MKLSLSALQEHFTSDIENETLKKELSNLANEFYNENKDLPENDFFKKLESSKLMVKYDLISKRIKLQNSIKTTKNISNIRNIIVFYFVLSLIGLAAYMYYIY